MRRRSTQQRQRVIVAALIEDAPGLRDRGCGRLVARLLFEPFAFAPRSLFRRPLRGSLGVERRTSFANKRPQPRIGGNERFSLPEKGQRSIVVGSLACLVYQCGDFRLASSGFLRAPLFLVADGGKRRSHIRVV